MQLVVDDLQVVLIRHSVTISAATGNINTPGSIKGAASLSGLCKNEDARRRDGKRRMPTRKGNHAASPYYE